MNLDAKMSTFEFLTKLKRMKTFLRLFLISGLCYLLSSCKYDNYDTLIKPTLPKDVIPDTVSYTQDVVPIFKSSSCYSCHTTATKGAGGNYVIDNYNDLKIFTTPHDT